MTNLKEAIIPATDIKSIDWTSEASVASPDGNGIISVFQWDTYAARVTFSDEQTVLVVLPKGSARLNPTYYTDRVQRAAIQERLLGAGSGPVWA